jgi:lipopolysaccharide export system protein LptC
MLPFRSGRVRIGRAVLILLLICALGSTAGGEGKGWKRKKREEKAAEQKKDASNIPLPVGHEAKGLVLPDYDRRGYLNNRFVAGIAKRLDDNHLQMRELKMTTYTAQQKPDLQIEMSDSVLDLKTRVISSQQRTTVHRADFQIAGDTMQFDTMTRQGTMVGNVKMVITSQSKLMPKESE